MKKKFNGKRVRKQRLQFISWAICGRSLNPIFLNACHVDGKNVNFKGCNRSHKRVFREFGSTTDVDPIFTDSLLKKKIPGTFFAHRHGGLKMFTHGYPDTLSTQGGSARAGYDHWRADYFGTRGLNWKDRIEAVRHFSSWFVDNGITHLVADCSDPIRKKVAVKILWEEFGLKMLVSARDYEEGYPPHSPYFSTLDNGIFPHMSKWISDMACLELKKGLRQTAEFILWRCAKTVVRRISTQNKTRSCFGNLCKLLKVFRDRKGRACGMVL